jgi:hypothetical protein
MSNSTSSETADIQVKPKKWFSFGMMLSAPLIVLLKMGFLFLLIGMLPTFLTMAYMRRRTPYVISTVAAFNFSGVFPYLLVIFLQGGRPRAVLDNLSDLTVWASMYGAALLGIAVVWLSPSIALVFLESIYRGRMRHMESLQKKLEEEWGTAIKGRDS